MPLFYYFIVWRSLLENNLCASCLEGFFFIVHVGPPTPQPSAHPQNSSVLSTASFSEKIPEHVILMRSRSLRNPRPVLKPLTNAHTLSCWARQTGPGVWLGLTLSGFWKRSSPSGKEPAVLVTSQALLGAAPLLTASAAQPGPCLPRDTASRANNMPFLGIPELRECL